MSGNNAHGFGGHFEMYRQKRADARICGVSFGFLAHARLKYTRPKLRERFAPRARRYLYAHDFGCFSLLIHSRLPDDYFLFFRYSTMSSDSYISVEFFASTKYGTCLLPPRAISSSAIPGSAMLRSSNSIPLSRANERTFMQYGHPVFTYNIRSFINSSLAAVTPDEPSLRKDVPIDCLQNFLLRDALRKREHCVESVERKNISVFARLVLRRRARPGVGILPCSVHTGCSSRDAFRNTRRFRWDIKESPVIKNHL